MLNAGHPYLLTTSVSPIYDCQVTLVVCTGSRVTPSGGMSTRWAAELSVQQQHAASVDGYEMLRLTA